MKRSRHGFTLIELLVVIAIIAILMSLMVPAVQKVREAAAKLQCGNNLKQIALAFHNFHDNFNRLPTGGKNTGTSSGATTKADLGWPYQIMPFIEKTDLYNQATNGNVSAGTAQAQVIPVPLYYCPARRTTVPYHAHAVCDYAANGGDYLGTADGNGIMLQNGVGSIHLLTITDGTSNTLMLGERRLNLPWLTGTTDGQDNEPAVSAGWDGDVIRWGRHVDSSTTPATNTNLPPRADLNNATLTASVGNPTYRFGSSHVAGINAAMCDGSVRIITFSANATHFRRVCLRNDNAVVDPNQL